MSKVTIPCNVGITRFYRVYVDTEKGTGEEEVKQAAIRHIIEGQENVLTPDPDLDIEEHDITEVIPDFDGTFEDIDDEEPERRIVRCNACGEWIGFEDELSVEDDVKHCPKCSCSDALMDVDHECTFSEKEVKELWNMFGDVNIDNQDRIMSSFLGFPAGTNRFDVWHWFDGVFPGGVHSLVYRMFI